jgi:phage/conjugal plasmid C-4 type zinc finger TraR family protein
MRPDTIDAASELEELQRQAAIQAHRIDRNAVSATHCDECGDAIEEARRGLFPAAGCASCRLTQKSAASCGDEIVIGTLKQVPKESWPIKMYDPKRSQVWVNAYFRAGI